MPQPRKTSRASALYVRLPAAEASKLDRAAFELKAAKQDLVTGLIASYVDPATAAGLEALGQLLGAGLDAKAEEEEQNKPPFGFSDRRQIVVDMPDESLTVGRLQVRGAPQPDVLNAAQVAALLQVEEKTVSELAEAGDLPGRRIGKEWRFARQAVLDWLGSGSQDA
jgi:excisionase family DNA binding protein